MKLSYDNITILADIFEGIEAHCDNDKITAIFVGYATLFIQEPSEISESFHIMGHVKNKYGGFSLIDNTTVADFEKLCAHLGVELIKIVHPRTLFD